MNNCAQVKFKISNVEDEINNITKILHSNNSEEIEEIFLLYPNLLKRLKKSLNDTESNKIIAKFFRSVGKDTKGKKIREEQVFQRVWNIVNCDFMNIISNIMNIKISNNKIFYANISFIPTIKRNIKKNEFNIFMNTRKREIKDFVFFEVSNILLNNKFEEIFKEKENLKLKNYFLEIVLNSILTDNKMQKISIYKPKISEKYKNIIIKDNFLLNITDKMYKEKRDFDDFLKNIWKFLKDNKEKIENII